MGVPAFYRWLSEKYPKIVSDVLEERPFAIEGHPIMMPDAREPNPSGLECDNFYIDCNGIIHPCSHPESGAQPKDEPEMFDNVCKYIDRLFNCVRPRKVFYIAIDGVAPRAKMNQQRARRFRSAQEAREQAETSAEVQANLLSQGLVSAEQLKSSSSSTNNDPFDSNTITPGTSFMYNLSKHLQAYIHRKVSTDPAWQGIKVLFSDASIPGEGEHKIMQFIRCQRAQPGYNPNTTHTLHGLDADLIMLALATHELHFYILREEVQFGRKGLELSQKRKVESGYEDAQKLLDARTCGNGGILPNEFQKSLQRLSVPVLREYLMLEFGDLKHNMPYVFDFERIIDDVVFFSFFVGNDFLPHLPSLDIRDGALDFLFNVYKRKMPTFPKSYLTYEGGGVNLCNVDIILAEVGAIEAHVFTMRHQKDSEEKKRREMQRQRNSANRGTSAQRSQRDGQALRQHLENVGDATDDTRKRGRAARALVKKEDVGLVELSNASNATANSESPAKKVKLEENESAANALKAKFANQNKIPKAKQEQDSSNNGNDEDVENEWQDTESSKSNSSTIARPDAIVSSNPSIKEEAAPQTVVVVASEKSNAVEAKLDEIVNANGTNDDANPDFVPSNGTAEAETQCVVDTETEKEEKEAEAKKKLANAVKTANQQKLDAYAANVQDHVRLYEPGYKNRYYTDKCKQKDIDTLGRNQLFKNYITGLCWIMQYYYKGCPSWKWYYPFHYAPFASDLINIDRYESQIRFNGGKPFTPIEQLLAVLPGSSCNAVPSSSRWLMTMEESPIIDFYPEEVPVDPNGKAMPWLWVVLLPFIDEERLIKAYTPTKDAWTEEERKLEDRGAGEALLYVHRSLDMDVLDEISISSGTKSKTKSSKKSRDGKDKPMTSLGDAQRWDGFTGLVRSEINTFENKKKQTQNQEGEEEEEEAVHIVAFESPRCLKHRSTILRNAKPPAPILVEGDKNICKPRLNRGQNIAYLGITPFRPDDHYQGNNNHRRVGNHAPQFNNYSRPPPGMMNMHERFTPVQNHGIPNPFVQHQHHAPPRRHHGNANVNYPNNNNMSNLMYGLPPPTAPRFRFQHPNGNRNNNNFSGPPQPSAPRFTFSNGYPPRNDNNNNNNSQGGYMHHNTNQHRRPPSQQQQQQQQADPNRMSNLRNQLRSTLSGGRGARGQQNNNQKDYNQPRR